MERGTELAKKNYGFASVKSAQKCVRCKKKNQKCQNSKTQTPYPHLGGDTHPLTLPPLGAYGASTLSLRRLGTIPPLL